MGNVLVEVSNELAAVAQRVSSSIVAVAGRPHGTSSGIHWGRDLIVTASHAVKRTEEIGITLPDGRSAQGVVVGRDGGTDLAVLTVQGLGESQAQFGEPESLRVGHLVFILARTRENGPLASLGAVSAVADSRRTWSGGTLDRYIRLDAEMYPGSSGGAVVDMEGRIVGMATSALSRVAPITIPVSTVKRVTATLLEKGRIPRGYLGVGLQRVAIPADLKTKLSLTNTGGIIVLSIEPEGPASRGGLVIGDIILSLDEGTVEGIDQLQTVLDASSVGKALKAQVLRGGNLTELFVVVGERPGKG